MPAAAPKVDTKRGWVGGLREFSKWLQNEWRSHSKVSAMGLHLNFFSIKKGIYAISSSIARPSKLVWLYRLSNGWTHDGRAGWDIDPQL